MSEYRPFNALKNISKVAVIWLNSYQYNALSPDSWIRIWNGAAHRLCTDGAANFLMDYCKNEKFVTRLQEFKPPDIVVGDFDSITPEARAYFNSFKSIDVRKIEDQNNTDLTKALNLLNEKIGSQVLQQALPESIILFGGFSGRFDHALGTLNAILLFYITHPSSLVKTIFALDGVNVITVLPKGESRIILDHSKITKICGILPICQKTTNVHTKGFRWNLDYNTPLEYGALVSNSNQIIGDEQVIISSQPIVFTFELNNQDDILTTE